MISQLMCAWLTCAPITGHASVIDGDTIYIAGERVRLLGVDAMELDTLHGKAAKWALVRIINNERVTCNPTGKFSHSRFVAKCSTNSIPDIGAEIIKRGHALDCPHYSHGHYRTMEAPDARTRLTPAPYCGGH